MSPSTKDYCVRTVTAFVSLAGCCPEERATRITDASLFLSAARSAYEHAGIAVQTTRIAFDSFEAWAGANPVAAVASVCQQCRALNVPLINIGSASSETAWRNVVPLLEATDFPDGPMVAMSMAVPFPCPPGKLAHAVRAITSASAKSDGKWNFRLGTAHHCGAGIPYFPVACASAETDGTFAVGLENDALVHNAFSAPETKDLVSAEKRLRDEMGPVAHTVQEIALQLERQHNYKFGGVDTSIAPGLDTPSLAHSFDALGLGKFGSPGTLAACAMMTSVLKTMKGVQNCGYSGLMLPVCEDKGLAESADAGACTVSKLVMYSAVCGIGLDTVPIPGPKLEGAEGHECGFDPALPENKLLETQIAGVLSDLSAMAHRLDKPLSCRFLPLPGRAPGDRYDPQSQYMCPANVMDPAA
ncbi:unnamed protein product [Pedinophyceae sp. YPF-701]|nr:unnamed protein product [Pedinophyceae sp. YPF-701]